MTPIATPGIIGLVTAVVLLVIAITVAVPLAILLPRNSKFFINTVKHCQVLDYF